MRWIVPQSTYIISLLKRVVDIEKILGKRNSSGLHIRLSEKLRQTETHTFNLLTLLQTRH